MKILKKKIVKNNTKCYSNVFDDFKTYTEEIDDSNNFKTLVEYEFLPLNRIFCVYVIELIPRIVKNIWNKLLRYNNSNHYNRFHSYNTNNSYIGFDLFLEEIKYYKKIKYDLNYHMKFIINKYYKLSKLNNDDKIKFKLIIKGYVKMIKILNRKIEYLYGLKIYKNISENEIEHYVESKKIKINNNELNYFIFVIVFLLIVFMK